MKGPGSRYRITGKNHAMASLFYFYKDIQERNARRGESRKDKKESVSSKQPPAAETLIAICGVENITLLS